MLRLPGIRWPRPSWQNKDNKIIGFHLNESKSAAIKASEISVLALVSDVIDYASIRLADAVLLACFQARLVCIGPEITARYPLVRSFMSSPAGVFVI